MTPQGMDMITEIKFACAKCGQRILVDSSAAGMTADCPSCGTNVTIPKMAGLHDREYAPAKRSREGLKGGNGGSSARAKSESKSENFADPELAGLRQELLDASVEQSRLADELAATRAEAAKVLANALHAQAELKSFQTERIALKGENTQLKQKIEAARSEAEEFGVALGASQREAEATAQQLREREAELESLRAVLAESQSDRTAALREAQSLGEQLAKLDTQLAAAHAGLAAAAQSEAKLRETAKALATAEEKTQGLSGTVEELKAEVAKLRKSLSKDNTGKDLIATTARLATAEAERDRHAGEARQLRDDFRKQEKETRVLGDDLKSLHCKLDEATRAAEARSESRLVQDNEVLRGIVARQNTELEQKHHQIVRLKRARFGLRLTYVSIATVLIAVGVLAVKYVPALRF